MERRYVGPGVQDVRQTMLRQEEAFREQVRELHRLYNVQTLLMAKMSSSAQPLASQPSSSSILDSRKRISLWDSSVEKLNGNSNSSDRTQPLFPKSLRIKIKQDCNFRQENFDSKKASGIEKFDLEHLPDDDVDNDVDEIESGIELEGSSSIVKIKGFQLNEPSDSFLSLGSGWGSSTSKQEMKHASNAMSNRMPQGHHNDTLKSLKRPRNSEEMVPLPLYPTIGAPTQTLPRSLQTAFNNERWGLFLEKLPELAKPQLQNEQFQNKELLKQEKLFNFEADEKLLKKINTLPHWISQGSVHGAKELEQCSHFSSQGLKLSSHVPMLLHGQSHSNAIGLWSEWRNLSEFQTGQWQTRKAIPAGQENLLPKAPAAFETSRHPVSSHASSQAGTISATSDLFPTQPSLKKTSRDPNNFLRTFETQEGLLPDLTSFLASPSFKPTIKDSYQSLSQSRAGKALSAFPAESLHFKLSFQGVPINNGVKEDDNKPVNMHINRTQELESRRHCLDQTFKVETKQDQTLEDVRKVENSSKALNNNQGNGYLSRTSYQMEVINKPRVGSTVHDLRECKKAVLTGNLSTSFGSLDSKGAYTQDKVIDLVTLEACHMLPRPSSSQEAGTSTFVLKDKESKHLLPSSCSSINFHHERALPWDFKSSNQSFAHADTNGQENPMLLTESALQMRLSHANSFNGQERHVSHEVKMAEMPEEEFQLRSTEILEDAVVKSNEVNSKVQFELETETSFQSFAAGFVGLQKNYLKAGEWVDKGFKQVVESLAPEKEISARNCSIGGTNYQHRLRNIELAAGSSVEPNQLNLLTRDQGGLCGQDLGATSKRPKRVTPPDVELGDSFVAAFSIQGSEDYAEENSDNSEHIAACTLLNFGNREVKIVREPTPSLLKQSVAWFANAIPECEDFQECEYQGTSKSTSETAISVSSPECGIVPEPKVSGRHLKAGPYKDYFRFLLKKLDADIEKDCTLEQDSYEKMTLELKPSIITLDSVSHYLPEKLEIINDVGRDTKNRTSKRGRRRKDFQSEILPSISCLSRQEIKEDIQAFSKLAKLVKDNLRQNSNYIRISTSSLHNKEAHSPAAHRRSGKLSTTTNVHRAKDRAVTSSAVLQPNKLDIEFKSSLADAAEAKYHPLGTWHNLTRRKRMQQSRRPTFKQIQYVV